MNNTKQVLVEWLGEMKSRAGAIGDATLVVSFGATINSAFVAGWTPPGTLRLERLTGARYLTPVGAIVEVK